ncbi:MAG: TetR/AcrR family transcriptional regulator [Arenibacterium sp.]
MPDDILKETETRHGNSKVTRNDWLRAARDRLVTKGVGDVKILTLSGELGVARSSFYWYFSDRADLLAALLAEWEARNTRCIVEKCGQPAVTVGEAVCNFFECFIDDTLFDQGLDFAVREWSRRDRHVRDLIEAADHQRLEAVTAMFGRYGFDAAEADARARILYFMQLGYHALDVREAMDIRMSRIEAYLKGFTGEEATVEVVAAFREKAFGLDGKG